MMTADDELGIGSENCGRVTEKVVNVDQRDELVAILKFKEGGTTKKAKQTKLTTILEGEEGGTKKTGEIQ